MKVKHSVGVWGSLRPHVGGERVEIEAATVRELLARLDEAHPGARRFIAEGIAVSIDGTVYQNSPAQPLPEGAEIFLLPQLRGG